MTRSHLTLLCLLALLVACQTTPPDAPPPPASGEAGPPASAGLRAPEAHSPTPEAKPHIHEAPPPTPEPKSPTVTLREVTTDALIARALDPSKPPLVINFWATWCPPCLEEWPEFERLAKTRGDDIELLAVALEPPEHKDHTLPPFVARAPQGMHVVWWRSDADDDTERLLEFLGGGWEGELPATFVYSEGKKRRVFLGPTTFDALDAVLAPLLD